MLRLLTLQACLKLQSNKEKFKFCARCKMFLTTAYSWGQRLKFKLWTNSYYYSQFKLYDTSISIPTESVNTSPDHVVDDLYDFISRPNLTTEVFTSNFLHFYYSLQIDSNKLRDLIGTYLIFLFNGSLAPLCCYYTNG